MGVNWEVSFAFFQMEWKKVAFVCFPGVRIRDVETLGVAF